MSYKVFFSFILSLGILLHLNAQVRSLDFYLQEGVKNSPLLKDFQGQLQSAKFDSLKLRATMKPQVDASALIMVAPVFNGYGYDQAISNGGAYEALAGVSQGLLTKKIYAPQFESLQIENQRIANTSRLSEHDLRKSIIDEYLNIYSDQNQILYLKTLYALLKDQEVVFKKLVEKSIYKQTDYLSFELVLQSQEISISQAQLKWKSDLYAINLICGITDTVIYQVESPGIKELTTSPELVAKDESASPFLLKFKIDSLQAANSKSLIDIKYLPKFNWFADAGLMASTPSIIDKSFGTSFGLNFSMPLYDGKQRTIQYQKNAVAQNAVAQYGQFFKNQYKLHIEQTQKEIAGIDDLMKQLRNQFAYSEQLISANKALLERGEVSVIDFIIAVKNQIDIKNLLNLAELQKNALINELNYWLWK